MLGSAQLVRMKIEVEDEAEELKMADSTVVKSIGTSPVHAQVWWVQRSSFCLGISQYEQTNDSGNPVAFERKTPTSTRVRL